MAAATSLSSAAPMGEINTTPLIDVLLVLLVMLIITIPAATHSLEVDLPQCGAGCKPPQPNPVRNRLTLDAADRLLWNGAPVTGAELAGALAATRALPVEPELQFAPDAAASYGAAAHTLQAIKASGVTRFGFVDNERHRGFGRPAGV